MLKLAEDAHRKCMSTFETDEHLHAEHRYTAGGGVVGVLTFVTRELFVLFDGFTIPPQATVQWVDAGLEKFSNPRVRSRLIPAMSGCDWKTDVLDLAGKSWDHACPTVRRSPNISSLLQGDGLYSTARILQFVLFRSLLRFACRSLF
jgi:hypothetical protein